MRTIRRISIGSAFKVGLVLCALVFAVLGVFVIVLPGLFGASLLGAMMGDQGGMSAFGVSFATSVIIYLAGIVVYGIFGGIVLAIEALLYNIVAGIVGGLEIELT